MTKTTLDQAIGRDSSVMSGTLCFRGTRIPVSTRFDHLEVGQLNEFYEGFSSVTAEMVEAVLDSSRRLIEETVTPIVAG